MLLLALAGCTGWMWFPAEKDAVEVEAFSVKVVGDVTAEHPSIFTGCM